MKKLKLTGKLSLNKETVARLSDNQMNDAKGGAPGFLSIGAYCTIPQGGCFTSQTRSLFCTK